MDTKDYIVDVNYNYGYFKEVSPLTFKLICLLQGIKPPKIEQACELGYGNGISVNIHASASNIEWYGTDFHVSHANFARDLARSSGNGAKLYADSFKEFLNRKDLPDFDFIAFHGVYSWIDDENRKILLEFIDKKLRPGGGVYASYNVYPGFCNMIPFRNLLKNFSDFMLPQSKHIIQKVGLGFEFFDKLVEAGAGFIQENQALKNQVDRMKNMDKAYLVHEFMNENWKIMDFMNISQDFSNARLQFVSQASFFSLLENVIYKPEQKELLNSLEHPFFKEYIRDFIHNTRFRKDYWIKGVQRLGIAQQQEMLQEIKVILNIPKEDVKFSINLGFGTIELAEDVYGVLLDILSDHKPKSMAQIQEESKGKFEHLAQVIEAIIILNALDVVSEVQKEEIVSKALEKTHQLNVQILENAKSGNQISVLASALTGEGVEIGRFEQLFLQSRLQGKKDPKEYAKHAWEILKVQQEKIIKEGKILQTEEENMKDLEERAKKFEKRCVIYKNLKIFKDL
ncbi:class I SAM-dependent methyltransferase [Helicobacter sp. 11S03491-1]|uniref:class I SAM-dependent methyltransferase n=1 Tax=Helicobacter sp. 11S03491-1 TaxID=1476196 RepID=UPI000BA53869|nr:class I SAM-dependent methyltransferase [Helicobacter sp. 11S03491-1]PAF42950.1 hypothetical protein BKH45_02460 [Helicobacter sp. 11S03491-1]